MQPQRSAVLTASLTLSVVICAYTADRFDDLCRAVDSVREQDHPVHEVVMVIDHNDALLARVSARFPDVHCVANASTRGLSGARNTGVANSSGEVVAFLDDDAFVGPEWSARLLDAYGDDVLGVGGAVRPDWRAPRPAWLPDEFLWVLGCSYRGQPTTRAEVRNAIGANMSFRRTAFDSTGGFALEVGRVGANAAGCEETDFSIRARRAQPGSRILLEPRATCQHTVTLDRVTKTYFRRRCWAEGASKAVVATLVGQDAALGAERRYASRVLPVGVVREFAKAVRGDADALRRGWMILEGLAVTTAAYVVASVRLRRSRA